MRASMFTAAFVAALVGYGSTILLVLSAAAAVGATPSQTASWVLAICLAKAFGSAWLSWRHRVPIVLAWSTPGAALIAATTGVSLAQAVGAFIIAGALIVLTGFVRPLGRAVAMIPDGIAGAMLAGVLLPFCMWGARAAESAPRLVLPMVAIFVIVRLINPAMAALAALAVGLFLAFASGMAAPVHIPLELPRLEFVAPEWDLGLLFGLAVPLYLVTMASQNLPGFATVRAAGFEPPVKDALVTTGGLSMLSGLFGAHPINMAAITAAICLGPDTHPDKAERWRVGLAYAMFWTLLGFFSPMILALLRALPPEVMVALVGLALLGPLMGAMTTAYARPESRFAASMTLVATASGVSLMGVGAAFWGLIAGIACHLLEQYWTNRKAAQRQ